MKGPFFIFITGGVMSGLGKGITAAALGALIRARGSSVRLRKFDPYLNVDPGTMNPCQHGEVFVTDDGAETDLDIGHYERFTGVSAVREDSITAGQIYSRVIEKERRGDYLGKTVQIIPHITDAIKHSIMDTEESSDFVICEIGGTVGDIEGLPFLEAIRQIRHDRGSERTLFIHLSWIPYLERAQELKTKPVQHSVKELQRVGIQPDVLVCRVSQPIPLEVREKVGLFCNIRLEDVIEACDQDNIYAIPLTYHYAGLDRRIAKILGQEVHQIQLDFWKNMVQRPVKKRVRVAVVGKYDGKDAYKSLYEALVHGGIQQGIGVDIRFILGEDLENSSHMEDELSCYDAILVPGGFAYRGAEGMIKAITYARKHQVPFLGICFGMQLAVIEGIRQIKGFEQAGSSEFGDTFIPVVAQLREWMNKDVLLSFEEHFGLGGTMRLGAYECLLQKTSLLYRIYGEERIAERHRHRYEVNGQYVHLFSQAGLSISGVHERGNLVECIERADHPWFVGVQFHPEFKSRPFQPHPLFSSFIAAAGESNRNHCNESQETVQEKIT